MSAQASILGSAHGGVQACFFARKTLVQRGPASEPSRIVICRHSNLRWVKASTKKFCRSQKINNLKLPGYFKANVLSRSSHLRRRQGSGLCRAEFSETDTPSIEKGSVKSSDESKPPMTSSAPDAPGGAADNGAEEAIEQQFDVKGESPFSALENARLELEEAIKEEEEAREKRSRLEEEAQEVAERAVQLNEEAAKKQDEFDTAQAQLDAVTQEEVEAKLDVSEAENALELSESALAKKEESIQSLLESRRLSDAADAEPIRLATEVSEEFVPASAFKELEGATLEDGKIVLGEGLEVLITETPGATSEPSEELDPHDIEGDSLESVEARPLEPVGDYEPAVEEEPEPEPEPEPVDATMVALQQELETESMKVEARRQQLALTRERLKDASERREVLAKEVERLREEADEARRKAAEADAETMHAMDLAGSAVEREMDAQSSVSAAKAAFRDVEKLVEQASERIALYKSGKKAKSDGEVEVPIRPEEEEEAVKAVKAMQEAIVDSPKALAVVETAAKVIEAKAVAVVEQEAQILKEQVPTEKPKPEKPPPLKPDIEVESAVKPKIPSSVAEKVLFRLGAMVQRNVPSFVLGLAVAVAGAVFVHPRTRVLLPQPPRVVSIRAERAYAVTKRAVEHLPEQGRAIMGTLGLDKEHAEEKTLKDALVLLLFGLIAVLLFQKLPGKSPLLGYLVAGVIIGPHGLGLVKHIHATEALAEIGVVFLLFNIGLELSIEKILNMQKLVFGLGFAQVLPTVVAIGGVAHLMFGMSIPASVVVGAGLALSSTAVAIQVLRDKNEIQTKHGRAAFGVLLFQDLFVVLLLIIIPLMSPKSQSAGLGLANVARQLGIAALKAVTFVSLIVVAGRKILQPIYKVVTNSRNPEILASTSLFLVLAVSFVTLKAGLSMALGAFISGLLMAETEFALQVESDISPYKGLLLGLFFQTVGMAINLRLLAAHPVTVFGGIACLLIGKTAILAGCGRYFGMSLVAATRAGMMLAPGGEFAFVAFKESVSQGIISKELSSTLFLIVGLSMALTPFLADFGKVLASKYEKLETNNIETLRPKEKEVEDISNHIIICGFGRGGQTVAQFLSEHLIPFVVLDMRAERVAAGREADLPVFYGDAGSVHVLERVGLHRAKAVVVLLDTPAAMYRTVYEIHKMDPHMPVFARAHDVDHGVVLERAGARVVVPEVLEPSLQLAAAILGTYTEKWSANEIATAINKYRMLHLQDLTRSAKETGTSLGYGFKDLIEVEASKPDAKPPTSDGALKVLTPKAA